MTVTSPILRRLFKGAVVLLLWLASVSASAASPAPRLHHAATLCAVRKLIRQARSLGGPLASRLRRVSIRVNQKPAWTTARTIAGSGEDEQAIQNDTLAAPFAADPYFELRPLGLFDATYDPRPLTRAFSPRSPRGPPMRPAMFHAVWPSRQIEVTDAGRIGRSEVEPRLR
jgi:hypothetical protein